MSWKKTQGQEGDLQGDLWTKPEFLASKKKMKKKKKETGGDKIIPSQR